MLKARDRLIDINVANFVHMPTNHKTRFHRDLVSASTEFIERKVKDYRDVLSNLARAMNGR